MGMHVSANHRSTLGGNRAGRNEQTHQPESVQSHSILLESDMSASLCLAVQLAPSYGQHLSTMRLRRWCVWFSSQLIPGLTIMTDFAALSVKMLFWLALVLSSLPLLEQLRQRWLCASLAGAFARECRRRRVAMARCAPR